MTVNLTDTGLRRLAGASLIQALRHPLSLLRSRVTQVRLLFLAVALFGTAISMIVLNQMIRMDDARVTSVLEFRSEWLARDFQSKLVRADAPLEGLAAFINSQKVIEAEEFHRFVQSIHYSDNSTTAFSWVPIVKSSDREAFVATARRTLGDDFDIVVRAPAGNIVPAAPHDEYLPLMFYETFDVSPGVMGIDVSSLPGRAEWVARARDEGRPIASPATRIFAHAGSTPGYVMFWPVYWGGAVPATIEERRRDFRGVAVSRIDFDKLLAGATANTPPIIGSTEFLVDHRPTATYDSATGIFEIDGAAPVAPGGSQTITREFDVLGRHWTLISHFSPQIVDSLRSGWPVAWLVLSLLLTVLTAAFIARERKRRWITEAIVEVRNSQLTGATGELVHRTEAFEGSEERFRQIFDGNPIGLALKTTNNQRFVRVNAAFCRMIGYPAEEVLARSPDEFVVPEDRGMIIPTAAGSLPEWHPRDKRYTTKLGEMVHAQVQSLHLGPLPSGEDVVLTIANDITEQRKTEAALHHAQKMEAIGNLTGGMAHDFNNLLGIIIGNLDLQTDLVKGNTEADELARRALDAALRGADLTSRLLAFARQQPLQPKMVAVNELVSGITKLLSRTLGEHIVISLNLAADAWPTVVDPAQLDASLTNLATNARDAMPKGGSLTVTTSNQTLDADYAAVNAEVNPGDYVMIEVSDTGAGMPPAVRDRIFEPFYSTKERGKGTGLGLSMVFGFIKQSGGHITVYSEPGIGTTFRLYLPRMAGEVASEDEKRPVPLVRGEGEVVLAVEDNAELLLVIVRQLTELGYRVVEAENAAAAIEVMEQQKIDLLLTDIIMPGGINGFDLAREVGQRWPKTRVLFTSGFPETTLNGLDRSLAADTRLLSKPYRRADLAVAVRDALDA